MTNRKEKTNDLPAPAIVPGSECGPPIDPVLERQMELAEKITREDHELLKRLSK